MIEPTVGRIVHYFLAGIHDKPHAALLVGVNGDRNINLAVFNPDGSHFRAENVQLLQDDDAAPADAPYAGWMVYQKGQAQKYDQLKAANGITDPGASHAAPFLLPTGIDLSDLHLKLATLEGGIEGKFGELGTWLTGVVKGFHERIASLEVRPAIGDATIKSAAPAPTPAPGTPAPAGDQVQQQTSQQQSS